MARRGDEEMVDAAPERRIRSTVTQVRKTKGRGFNDDEPMDEADERRPQAVQTERTSKGGPIKSVEGYVIFVSNIHEEADEESLQELFLDYGPIKNLYLNLDRRSGFCKGYALIEYETKEEAEAAVQGTSNQNFYDQPLKVTWCFGGGPIKRRGQRK